MIPPAAVVQNCYVVGDLEEGCARFNRLYGIGPFVGGAVMELDDHLYRGRPAAPIKLRAAFCQAGEINIELVQLMSDAPNAFTAMFPRGTIGFHHAAMFCDDLPATCRHFQSIGHGVISEASLLPGVRVAFIDTRQALGHMIELYPENPTIRAVFEGIRRAADTWDRKALIVPLSI